MNSPYRQLWTLFLVLGLMGCSRDTTAQATREAATTATGTESALAPPKRHLLSISAYNYTDRYIDDFRVNGQGGGNLSISNEGHGNGGGGVCCVSWLEGSKLPKKIEVMWTASYCKQRRTNSVGESRDWREPILHIAELEFNGPVPKNPKIFEVHFYKDGHIELAMTERDSGPRLQLPFGDGYARPSSDSTDPPCPPDYERVKAYNNPIRVDARPKTAKGAQP